MSLRPTFTKQTKETIKTYFVVLCALASFGAFMLQVMLASVNTSAHSYSEKKLNQANRELAASKTVDLGFLNNYHDDRSIIHVKMKSPIDSPVHGKSAVGTPKPEPLHHTILKRTYFDSVGQPLKIELIDLTTHDTIFDTP